MVGEQCKPSPVYCYLKKNLNASKPSVNSISHEGKLPKRFVVGVDSHIHTFSVFSPQLVKLR